MLWLLTSSISVGSHWDFPVAVPSNRTICCHVCITPKGSTDPKNPSVGPFLQLIWICLIQQHLKPLLKVAATQKAFRNSVASSSSARVSNQILHSIFHLWTQKQTNPSTDTPKPRPGEETQTQTHRITTIRTSLYTCTCPLCLNPDTKTEALPRGNSWSRRQPKPHSSLHAA